MCNQQLIDTTRQNAVKNKVLLMMNATVCTFELMLVRNGHAVINFEVGCVATLCAVV